APNPKVGALVARGGEVVGEGYHRRAGEPHAEPLALEAAGERARGATLYVTLEPCDHHGRTPPCTEAILAAGVARVVACHGDPDLRVRGAGFSRLRAAGVAVEVGLLAEEALALNLAYLAPQLLGRPAVTLKWAMSWDGKIATVGGESRWISSPAARRWALSLREEHDAILVGSGTVLADDPQLTRRLGWASGPFRRLVLDRRLRTPATARLFTEPGAVVIYTESTDSAPRRALERAGAEVVVLERVTPEAVLAELQRQQVRSVLVEGGGGVHAAFLESGCYDRVLVVAAPLLIGGLGAPGPVGGAGERSLAAAPRLERTGSRRMGPDRLLWGYRPGCLAGLSESVAGW
nr:bifunctional diaminohydroxyphosphoribosylaminopyrimidine deaminase/5-amino-6-(5-phosphoribosylamino)uracil reductase RibD [Thermoanaerobaculia bacterium]